MTEPGDASALSWRTHCHACGARKEKRWGPGRLTLSKHCPNDTCSRFGIPLIYSVKIIVTIDRLGRRHTAHKEVAVRRRPTFKIQDPFPGETGGSQEKVVVPRTGS